MESNAENKENDQKEADTAGESQVSDSTAPAADQAGPPMTSENIAAENPKNEDDGGDEEEEEEEEEEGEEEEELDAESSGLLSLTGDEEVLETDSLEDATAVEKLDESFFYNYSELQSKPIVTDDFIGPIHFLKLQHSFGYDSIRRSNLQVVGPGTLAMICGAYLQIFDVQSKSQTFLRMTGLGTAAAFTVDVQKTYIAVGESGTNPDINIFHYPSLQLYRILRNGAQQTYAKLDFSPKVNLLASISGMPDFILTVWKWRQEVAMFRCKAFSTDVQHVSFSLDADGVITTAGAGHIRFWKMAETFTGLKLEGQLGKFGKKEITDIEGYFQLPSLKIVSGSEWGNMLLWDGGLCKLEIARRGNRKCHNGHIQQILIDEEEIITVGIDGYIRAWDPERVDLAQVQEESDCFELEPSNELKVGNNVQLSWISKSVDPEDQSIWYAQDAKGAIWKLDLSFQHTASEPQCIMSFHGGPILSCDVSKTCCLVATCGFDGSVRIFDYILHQMISIQQFNQPATVLKWLSTCVDPRGSMIVVGFEDGIIRVIRLVKADNSEAAQYQRTKTDFYGDFVLAHVLKPHSGRVNCIEIDSSCSILATAGEDCTVFFFDLSNKFSPIGFIKTPSPVTCLNWTTNPKTDSKLLVCCVNGEAMQIKKPIPDSYDVSETFLLSALKANVFKFGSRKSQLKRNEYLEKQKETGNSTNKRSSLGPEQGQNKQDEAVGEEDDEEEEEEEEEEKEELWEPYYPETPSPILYGFYSDDGNSFWLSMGEYDVGYLYECEFSDGVYEFSELPRGRSQIAERKTSRTVDKFDDNLASVPVDGLDDIPITVIKFSPNGKIAVLGLQDGRIRVGILLKQFDIRSINSTWTSAVHDTFNGDITSLTFSADGAYLFSTGLDGNFFMLSVADSKSVLCRSAPVLPKISDLADLTTAEDITDEKAYSIEQSKQRSEQDRLLILAEKKKTIVRETLEEMRTDFKRIVQRNLSLPPYLQLFKKEFELDAEIIRQIKKKKEDMIEITFKEMAWEQEKYSISLDKVRSRYKDRLLCERIVLRSFLSKHSVCSFRLAVRSMEARDQVIAENRISGGPRRSEGSKKQSIYGIGLLENSTSNDSDLGTITPGDQKGKFSVPLTGGVGMRIKRALGVLADKQRQHELRKQQWDALRADWHPLDYEDPDDIEAIDEARRNNGEYKLKSAADYIVPENLKMNASKMAYQIVLLKDNIHLMKKAFNQKFLALRDRKVQILKRVVKLRREFYEIQGFLGTTDMQLLSLPFTLHDEEMPEKKIEYNKGLLREYKEQLKSGYEINAMELSTDEQDKFSKDVDGNVKVDWSATYLMQEESELNNLQNVIRQDKIIRMKHRQDMILNKVFELLTIFDGELKMLRHERFKLDVDLKMANFRMWIMLQSRLLLIKLDLQEDVLVDDLCKKKDECDTTEGKVTELNLNLELSYKEIEKQHQHLKALEASVLASLGDNQWTPYLMKVFKKKMKRKHKKENADGDDEDSDESDSDDEELDDESDEESNEESDEESVADDAEIYDVDICPDACDIVTYLSVCNEREKRLDFEEIISSERKSQALMIKDLEYLTKRAKQLAAQASTAEQELIAFQREKQRNLNALDWVATLRLNQIRYFANDRIPRDMTPVLVFESPTLTVLENMGSVLVDQQRQLQILKREQKKRYRVLAIDKKHCMRKINAMTDYVNNMLEEKFGRRVSLRKLESIMINKELEELRIQQGHLVAKWTNELANWDDHISQIDTERIDHVQENTNLMDQMRILMNECREQERDLNRRAKTGGVAFSRGLRLADAKERRRLQDQIDVQRSEIQQLNEEIYQFSRKLSAQNANSPNQSCCSRGRYPYKS